MGHHLAHTPALYRRATVGSPALTLGHNHRAMVLSLALTTRPADLHSEVSTKVPMADHLNHKAATDREATAVLAVLAAPVPQVVMVNLRVVTDSLKVAMAVNLHMAAMEVAAMNSLPMAAVDTAVVPLRTRTGGRFCLREGDFNNDDCP